MLQQKKGLYMRYVVLGDTVSKQTDVSNNILATFKQTAEKHPWPGEAAVQRKFPHQDLVGFIRRQLAVCL